MFLCFKAKSWGWSKWRQSTDLSLDFWSRTWQRIRKIPSRADLVNSSQMFSKTLNMSSAIEQFVKYVHYGGGSKLDVHICTLLLLLLCIVLYRWIHVAPIIGWAWLTEDKPMVVKQLTNLTQGYLAVLKRCNLWHVENVSLAICSTIQYNCIRYIIQYNCSLQYWYTIQYNCIWYKIQYSQIWYAIQCNSIWYTIQCNSIWYTIQLYVVLRSFQNTLCTQPCNTIVMAA